MSVNPFQRWSSYLFGCADVRGTLFVQRAVPACIKSGVAHPFIQESHRGFPSVFVGTIVPSFADTSLRLHCRSSIRIRCISSRKGTHPNQGLLRWRTSSICPSTGKYRYLRSSFSTLFANCVLVAPICVFVAS